MPIGPDATAGDLHDELAHLGAKLMLVALGALERGSLHLTPQAARRRDLREQDRQGRDAHRLDAAVARRSTIIAAACRLSRRVVRTSRRGPREVLRTTKGSGEGQPGRVLDDKLTIACGDGLGAARRAATRRRKADVGG